MNSTVTGVDLTSYANMLAAADDVGAVAFATSLLRRGVGPQDVLLDLVAPSQVQVGDLWARAQWSVAREHAATHVNEQVVAAVSTWAAVNLTNYSESRGTAVVACVDGEWHSMPAKLFAAVIRLHGWDVRFLGASVPGPHLISYLHECGPDVLAVSCSLPTRLTTAHRIITAAHQAGVPVLAGGAGFGPDARWARRLGADRAAATATAAIRELADWPPTMTLPTGEAHHPFVDTDEHALVAKRRTDLVADGMDRLEQQFPRVRDYSPAQREATRADLEHIIDFLAAALFIDDIELFTTFAAWLCVILGSRHVPLATVETVLSAYAENLYDFPRAVTYLDAARATITGAITPPADTTD